MSKRKSKITVKHFLNKNLKSINRKYPIYVSIWFQDRLTKIRSLWWTFIDNADPDDQLADESQNYMSETEFNLIDREAIRTAQAMADEAKAIEAVIRYFFERHHINILTRSYPEFLKQSMRSIPDIISNALKQNLQDDFAKNKDIKVVSARLMINWTNELSFINLFDGLNALSNDGKVQTEFYKKILATYETSYLFVKQLYHLSQKMDLRLWHWIVDRETFNSELKDYLKAQQHSTKEAAKIVAEADSQILQHYNTLNWTYLSAHFPR